MTNGIMTWGLIASSASERRRTTKDTIVQGGGPSTTGGATMASTVVPGLHFLDKLLYIAGVAEIVFLVDSHVQALGDYQHTIGLAKLR